MRQTWTFRPTGRPTPARPRVACYYRYTADSTDLDRGGETDFKKRLLCTCTFHLFFSISH